jgi:hypothetical protein
MRLLAIIVLVGAAGAPLSGQDNSKPKSSTAPPDTTADQLAADVLTNELRAEELYLDRDVTVRGKVGRVIRSRLPVDDKGHDAFAVEFKLSKTADEIVVRFFFNRDERDRLAKLLPGQEVVLRGHGTRFMVYPDETKKGGKELIEVQFRDSRVLEVKAPAPAER